ncbi:MAG: hypothetical protein ABW321_19375 [Polyangiales bacterium]
MRRPPDPRFARSLAAQPSLAAHAHRRSEPWLALGISLALGACDSNEERRAVQVPVAGSMRPDAGQPPRDAGQRDAATPDTGSASDDAGMNGEDAGPGPVEPEPRVSPFGLATSASSSRSFASWAARAAALGVGSVRGFDQAQAVTVLDAAAAARLELTGILQLSISTPSTFPSESLGAWERYVAAQLDLTAGSVRHWEVWNEPPNFSEDKSPESYAALVSHAYEVAQAQPKPPRLGLAAQSVNGYFLEQTLRAGARDHFDFVTVHPYETLALVEAGWEAQFMSIVPTLRKLLAAQSPGRADAPIWFTELGQPAKSEAEETRQADLLIKAYTMSIAQGAARVYWFEALDGDSGPFGLIAANQREKPAYRALGSLITALGVYPQYVGYVTEQDQPYHMFVFQAATGGVAVMWTPPGKTGTVQFDRAVRVVDPSTQREQRVTFYELTGAPIIVLGIPQAWLDAARSGRGKAFPWGGDYSGFRVVTCTAPNEQTGLHWLGTPKQSTQSDTPARDVSDAAALSFTVDPSFLSYDTVPITITAEVRRNGSAAAGFNLKYESTEGWKTAGDWYDIPSNDRWYEKSWFIEDSQFVGKWGYHFSFDSDATEHSRYSVRRVTVTKHR